jgi:hypothetical protein
MAHLRRKLSPSIFGLILICFFLPFATISCQQQQLLSLTGVQLVTGTTIEEPSFFQSEAKQQKIPGEPLAAFALVSTCVGLGTSFLKSRKNAIIPAVVGALGSVLLLSSKAKIDNEVLQQGRGLVQVEYGIGFWLSFLLFLVASVLNAWIFLQSRNSVRQSKDG